MNNKILLLVSLIFLLIVLLGGGGVIAQSSGFGTPEEALEKALSDYMSLVGDEGLWELGEIFEDGSFAYSIAKHKELSGVEEGNVLILARQQNNLWNARTPEKDKPEDYNSWLAEFPDSLLSEFDKSYFYLYTQEDFSFLGSREVALHKFPWPIRQNARLTQKDGSSHTNQLDFVVLSSGDVYASKPGVVVFKKESSNVGGCDISLWQYANLVVIQHSDIEYSWYFHLTQNSVTVEVGDLIGYGTKIGQQGNTGFACGSTGIHLHFMVSTSAPSAWPDPESVGVAPWPPSGSILKVDFVESTWASLVVGDNYESQNAPPPGICRPEVESVSLYDGTYCSNSKLEITSTGLYLLDSLNYEDKIESIEIPAGWSVGLYGDQNELGPNVCLNITDETLWNNIFENGEVAANRASWMRVFSSADCPLDFSTGVKMYSTTDYDGDPVWGMVGARTTDAPSHIVSSIEVPEGHSVLIWDEDGSGGNQLCLYESAPNLSGVGWSGNPVESVRLVEGNVCGNIDTVAPTVTLTFPEEGGTVIWPRTDIIAEGFDEVGINLMHFFGWYDDGSGAGFDWHYLGSDNDESDGWRFTMNLTPLAEPLISVWVYAEDYSANFGSVLANSITVSKSFTFGDGFSTRGGEARENSGIDQLVPKDFPSISDIPEMNLNPEIEDQSNEELSRELSEEEESQSGLPAESESRKPAPTEPENDNNNVNTLSELKLKGPEGRMIFWGETIPELCWEPLPDKVSYFVRVEGNGKVMKSGWIQGACWKPSKIAGLAGEYSWKVKYKDKSGKVSKWSKAEFSVKDDLLSPTVQIIRAEFLEGGGEIEHRIGLTVNSIDVESGVKTIYVLAWYDDGGGAKWHEMKVVDHPETEMEMEIVSPVSVEKVGKLWVYVEDFAGNFGADSVPRDEITVSSTLSNTKRLWDLNFLLKN